MPNPPKAGSSPANAIATAHIITLLSIPYPNPSAPNKPAPGNIPAAIALPPCASSALMTVKRANPNAGKNIGTEWVKGLQGIDRADIPIYSHPEIQAAIAQSQTIFIRPLARIPKSPTKPCHFLQVGKAAHRNGSPILGDFHKFCSRLRAPKR
jgi:hypothetical protein